jgi:hypothetical protein
MALQESRDNAQPFYQAFGQAVTKESVVERIQKEVASWEAEFGKKV